MDNISQVLLNPKMHYISRQGEGGGGKEKGGREEQEAEVGGGDEGGAEEGGFVPSTERRD